MEEIFESESFKIRYDEETNACVLTLMKYSGRDHFRTPLMHTLEIIRKHSCRDLIIDEKDCVDVSETDWKWVRKTVIPRLASSSCKHIYFVVPEECSGTKCDDEPYCLFSDRFKVDKVMSEKFALMMIKNHCEIEAGADICSMTREQALAFMELPANANDFMIDERFWKLSKQLRGDNSAEGKQRIADLSAAYDIATGRRDERVAKEIRREKEKKFLGKTGDEWRTYFSYTWYKYLIGLILIILAGNLLNTILFSPRYDCGVLSIGHFANESDYVEKFLLTRMGYKNPMIGLADIVVPNEQGQSQNAYADQTASTLLMSGPNVLVFDEATIPYYFGYLTDARAVYELLRENLTPDQFRKLRPVYLTERESQALLDEYELNYGAEMFVDDDLSLYDNTPVMIGIAVDDEEAIRKLGYENLWPETKTTLVFSIYEQSMDLNDSEKIILNLLRSVL